MSAEPSPPVIRPKKCFSLRNGVRCDISLRSTTVGSPAAQTSFVRRWTSLSTDPSPRPRALRTLRPVAAILLIACLAPVAFAQRGALTRPRTLVELVDQSETILVGRVVSAVVEPHPDYPKLHTVLITLRVDESLKGAPGSTFIFREFIWDVRDRADAAGYRKGQHLLLLLNKPTSLGLVSPAGLEQGRFRILRDSTGREVAINGAANRGLFLNLSAQLQKKGVRLSAEMSRVVAQPPAGPLPLDDLRRLIREMRASRGGN